MQILNHTSALFKAYEDMKLELETVIRGRIQDYKEAEAMIVDAAGSDGQVGEGDVEMRDAQQNRDAPDEADREVSVAVKVNKGKKKVRIVPAAGNTQHAGGDRPTADREDITTGVPGKEQLTRAEALARQGRRA